MTVGVGCRDRQDPPRQTFATSFDVSFDVDATGTSNQVDVPFDVRRIINARQSTSDIHHYHIRARRKVLMRKPLADVSRDRL